MIRSGDLILVRRGAYATRKAIAWGKRDPRRSHALQAAAVESALSRATVSHQSAALIHGLDLLKAPEEGVVTVTTPPGSRSGGPGAERVIRYAAELGEDHTATVLGTRVTSVARTVIDIARTSPFIEGVIVADSALRARMRDDKTGQKTTMAELGGVLEACARWPGIESARRVVKFADSRSESPLESAARVFFREHGLQAPELQVPLYDDEGNFIGRVDFYWSTYKTIAEADGLLKFDARPRTEVARLLERDRRLRRTGRHIVHFTWGELFRDNGYGVAADIRANFADSRHS
jgi:very-short-patch-repair endonuclease